MDKILNLTRQEIEEEYEGMPIYENKDIIVFKNNFFLILVDKTTNKVESWIVEGYLDTLIKTYYFSKNEKEKNNG